MSGVQVITVAEGDGDQRVDRWLRRMFPHVSQGRIEKMCRKGELRVDGGRVKASDRIEVGNQIRIPPLPEPEEVARNATPARSRISDADVALIQAERADPWGNLTYNKAARNFAPAMCMAAKTTIVQVREIVDLGATDAEHVVTPSIFVDRIVEIPEPISEAAILRQAERGEKAAAP